MLQFILTGFVTDNKGLQTSQRGTKYIRFQVTFSKPMRDGQSREESWWCSAFGKTAEDAAAVFAAVGRNAQVYVGGSLSRSKKADQNGTEFWDTDMIANFVLAIPQQVQQVQQYQQQVQYQQPPMPPMPQYQQQPMREATADMMPDWKPQGQPQTAQGTFSNVTPGNYTPAAQNAKSAPQNPMNTPNAIGNAMAAAGDDVPF